MDWNQDLCLKLIAEYEKYSLLWDRNNEFHYCSKSKKQEAWQAIARNLNVDVKQAKQKMYCLLGSLRREKSRGRRENYISKWFAFDKLKFMLDREKPRKKPYVNFSAKACPPTEDGTLEQEKLEFQADASEAVLLNDPKEQFNQNVATDEETITQAKNDAVMQIFKDSDSEPSAFNNLIQSDLELNIVSEMSVNDQATHSQAEQQIPITQNLPPAPITKKGKKKHKPEVEEDPRIEEAFKILKYSVSNLSQAQDACSVYGQHVGNKLRTYTSKTRSHVEHIINNILFEADLGKYDIVTTFTPIILNSPNAYNIKILSTSSLNSGSPTSTETPQTTANNATPVPNQSPFVCSSEGGLTGDQQNAIPSATNNEHLKQNDTPPLNTSVADSSRDSDNSHSVPTPKEEQFTCELCNKTFTHSLNFKFHLLSHVKKEKLGCNFCSKSFSLACDLKQHLKICARRQPLISKLQDKRFTSVEQLKRHSKSFAYFDRRKEICAKNRRKNVEGRNRNLDVHNGFKENIRIQTDSNSSCSISTQTSV